MAAVNFPRDAQGRIIVGPEIPAQAPEPAPRPVRATEPGQRVPMADRLPRSSQPQDGAAVPIPSRRVTAAAAVAGLFLAVALIVLLQRAPVAPRIQPTAQSSPLSTPAPSAAPTLAPAPSPAPAATDGTHSLSWTVNAYDSSGHWIGPISAERPIRVLRPEGTEWMIVEAPAWGGAPASGEVRIYAVDLLAEPPPRPTPLPTSPPPPPPAPVYVPLAQPAAPIEAQPTMAPPPTPAPVTAAPTPQRCELCRPNDGPKRPTSGREDDAGGVKVRP